MQSLDSLALNIILSLILDKNQQRMSVHCICVQLRFECFYEFMCVQFMNVCMFERHFSSQRQGDYY